MATNSYDEGAQALSSTLLAAGARLRPCQARLADWVDSLGAEALAEVSTVAADQGGRCSASPHAPSTRWRRRGALYAELRHHAARPPGPGSTATSPRSSPPRSPTPDGEPETLPMAAVRGLATTPTPAVRRAAYEAELAAWPTVAVACAAALNAIKGEANAVNRRRGWADPLDAVAVRQQRRPGHVRRHAARPSSRRCPTSAAGCAAKARLHGHDGGLPLVGPVRPAARRRRRRVAGPRACELVDGAFGGYSPARSAALADRAVGERWIDAEPRDGKRGGAFCMPFIGDRSLVLLNWSDSVDSVQTLAHELGHAYHNTQLADAHAAAAPAADGPGRDGQHLLRDAGGRAPGSAAAAGAERLALLDTDLRGRHPGRRRHPQPVPVRVRAVRRGAPAHAVASPS